MKKQKLIKEIEEMNQYLTADETKFLRERREKTERIRKLIRYVKNKKWFKQLTELGIDKGIQEEAIDKECEKCPFYITWIKRRYEKEFATSYKKVIATEEEK